ncbi:MAG: primosomal protein N' [Planctomycetaceae bacterium]|nr:primosomal protein N' [Planctomycetaceae bacterium]
MSDEQKELFEVEVDPWQLDDESDRRIASVVFAEGVADTYSYLIPDELQDDVVVGKRVRVPLGRGNRSVVGYCVEISTQSGVQRRLKSISSVLDETPLASPAMLRLTQWMADHYLTTWGKALEGVLPAAIRHQAGTRERTFYSVPTHIAARLTQLKLPPKQAAILKHLAGSQNPLTAPQIKSAIACTDSPLKGLLKKGLIDSKVARVEDLDIAIASPEQHTELNLNPDQQSAIQAIISAVQSGQPETILLHGITGSGKTEVYIQSIQEVVSYGRQAIVLVPEISLTPQTQRRFRSRFPQVAVLHSHLTDRERNWHWKRIASGEVNVVVGARSAIFAPTPHLGLIVIDEEHDSSFKQDSLPRYHARDVATQRSQMEQIPLILGSATPSLESWQRTKTSNSRLISLPRRVLDLPLPDVVTIDLRDSFRSRQHRGAISRQLQQAIQQALSKKEQIILLLNRRGFSTHIQCPACGEVVRCPDCELALTHHRQGEIAVCHYCDYQIPAPPVCPECKFEGIRYSGQGTQRLEAEVRSRFPNASCLRMDSDTMRQPGSHEKSLSRFRRGEVQILVGTQMIAKGLDFPNVTVVGVINADTALHLPDFRAAERTFQLVTQVAGRTGRGPKGGRVYVQTSNPEHMAIRSAERHDYHRFADDELPIRAQFNYPPYGRMVRVIARGTSETQTEQVMESIADLLRTRLADDDQFRLLGPAPAPIEKLRGKYRFHMLLQIISITRLKEALRAAQAAVHAPDDVQWIIDVDPIDMM